MGTIHVNRNRQSLGQFTDQEVADGLQSGRFLPDDLGWHESMDAWQPLSSFANLPPPSAPVITPIPALPETPGVSTGTLAWETTPQPPLLTAVFETIKLIFSKPVEAFQSMPTEGGIGKPLKYYVMISWATGAVAIVYQAAATLINPEVFSGPEMKNIPHYAVALGFAGFLVLMPLFLFLGSFISSGILHVALMLVGGARKPYETTYRVFCYASGSTSVLQLIPICGGWLYPVASLIYSIIGLKEAHRTELWRPIVAVLLICVLCCGAIFGMTSLAVWLGYSAMAAK